MAETAGEVAAAGAGSAAGFVSPVAAVGGPPAGGGPPPKSEQQADVVSLGQADDYQVLPGMQRKRVLVRWR